MIDVAHQGDGDERGNSVKVDGIDFSLLGKCRHAL
jgi:hypothetical protein